MLLYHYLVGRGVYLQHNGVVHLPRLLYIILLLRYVLESFLYCDETTVEDNM